MEQKTFSSFIQYLPSLVVFIFLVHIHNFLNMVSLQNEVIISLLRDIKHAPTTSLPIVTENIVPCTVPNTADNTIYYVAGGIISLVFIGVVCYFLFNSKPKSSPTGSSTPSPDGADENPEKLTKINLDLQSISQEREEILNKLNEMSGKYNVIGSINTKIEELYDYLTDPASTAENVKITEKINTLIDNQAVNNAGIKQVMESNLGFVEGTKRVFWELTTDRHVLNTTLNELAKKQAELEINQHDLSKNQNDLEIARGIMENDVDFHCQNIEHLNHNAQNCSDQLSSINQSCTDIITTLNVLGEKQSLLTINQVDLSTTQDQLAKSHAAMENTIERAGNIGVVNSEHIKILRDRVKTSTEDIFSLKKYHREQVEILSNNDKTLTEDVIVMKQSYEDIMKLIAEHMG